MDNAAPAFTAGSALIITVTYAVSAQPVEAVPITVYVVGPVGVATGFEIVGLLNVAAGDHTYVLAPLTLSVVLLPAHIVVPALGVIVAVIGSTETVSVEAQPCVFVPVTV